MVTLLKDMERRKHCPDCGAKIGKQHHEGCDVDRCSECEGQRLSCGCDSEAGIWKGIMMEEYIKFAEENNLYTKWTENGWEKCDINDEGARHDLNTASRMMMEQASKK
jgi:hypothetical protein